MESGEGLFAAIHNYLHFFIYLLLIIIVLWFGLFWLTWTQGKERVSRAQNDITESIWDNGKIIESDVEGAISRYCINGAYIGYTIDFKSHEYGVEPEYLGQPMYIEFTVTYHIFNKDIPIKGKSDIGNARIYGKGFNTEHAI